MDTEKPLVTATSMGSTDRLRPWGQAAAPCQAPMAVPSVWLPGGVAAGCPLSPVSACNTAEAPMLH